MRTRERLAGKLNLALILNVLWLLLFGVCGLMLEPFTAGYAIGVLYIFGTAALGLVGAVGLADRLPWAARVLDLCMLLASPLAVLAVLLMIVGWSLMPEMLEIWGNVWWAYIGVGVATVLSLGGAVNIGLLVWLRLGRADQVIWEAHSAERGFEREMGVADETTFDMDADVAVSEKSEEQVSRRS